MSDREKKDVRPGPWVDIVLKQGQLTGELTRGFVPHGIKVKLETGEVGRVKEVVGEDQSG